MTGQEHTLTIDRLSFQLGMMNCFVEMVACGVKRLALSPPLLPADYREVQEASDRMVAGFGIRSYLEKSLLITDLQPPGFTRGKWSILYFRSQDVLDSYLALKRRRAELEEAGKFDRAAAKEISRRFMRLLSYPDEVIEERLSKPQPESPFMLID